MHLNSPCSKYNASKYVNQIHNCYSCRILSRCSNVTRRYSFTSGIRVLLNLRKQDFTNSDVNSFCVYYLDDQGSYFPLYSTCICKMV